MKSSFRASVSLRGRASEEERRAPAAAKCFPREQVRYAEMTSFSE